MNILHYFFRKITPICERNWLSERYAKWYYKFMNELTEEQRMYSFRKDNEYFEVKGAGDIRISQSVEDKCDTAVGFSFDVEWGRNGFVGGVIDKIEAKRMAEYILNRIENE